MRWWARQPANRKLWLLGATWGAAAAAWAITGDPAVNLLGIPMTGAALGEWRRERTRRQLPSEAARRTAA